ncbi:MAG TPA: helix-turn-helix domain-containing protein [Xanthobacteraceae bacterium]|jgi:DNA-binding HxlR family transcriptional regulator|nr:helix-turn-helix domain-containing protein [Xanthobacteraceae bacterium]
MSAPPRRYFCPVNVAIDVIAGKWKPGILCELNEGPRRFSDLKRVLSGISEKVLSTHLRQLEGDGIVKRREFLDGGVHATEYSFTTHGATLRPALVALAKWGLANKGGPRGSKAGRSPRA